MSTPTMPWLIGPANVRPPPATMKNHALPPRGHPTDKPAGVNRPGQRRTAEPVQQAAPLPVVTKNGAGGPATPANGGFGHNDPPPDMKLPLPPATRERHALRGPEEYPMDTTIEQQFYIQRADPKRGIVGDYPPDRDVQWVGITVWGQPQPSIESTFLRKGWEPVLTGDFDGRYDGRFVPRTQPGPIMVGGQMLVARPMSWSKVAQELAYREAMAPLQIKVRQITQGETDKITMGAQHKSALAFNHVKKFVEGISLPAPPE